MAMANNGNVFEPEPDAHDAQHQPARSQSSTPSEPTARLATLELIPAQGARSSGSKQLNSYPVTLEHLRTWDMTQTTCHHAVELYCSTLSAFLTRLQRVFPSRVDVESIPKLSMLGFAVQVGGILPYPDTPCNKDDPLSDTPTSDFGESLLNMLDIVSLTRCPTKKNKKKTCSWSAVPLFFGLPGSA